MATVAESLNRLLKAEPNEENSRAQKSVRTIVKLMDELVATEKSHFSALDLLPPYFEACIQADFETETLSACKRIVEQLLDDSKQLSELFEAVAQGVTTNNLSKDELDDKISKIQACIENFYKHSTEFSQYDSKLRGINARVKSREIWVSQGHDQTFMDSAITIAQRGPRYRMIFETVVSELQKIGDAELTDFQSQIQNLIETVKAQATALNNKMVKKIEIVEPKYYFNHLKLEVELSGLSTNQKRALELIVAQRPSLSLKAPKVRIKIENDTPITERQMYDELAGIFSELIDIGIAPNRLSVGEVGKSWLNKAKAAYGTNSELATFLNAQFISHVANTEAMNESDRRAAFHNWLEATYQGEMLSSFTDVTQSISVILATPINKTRYENFSGWMQLSGVAKDDVVLTYLSDFSKLMAAGKVTNFPAQTQQLVSNIEQINEQEQQLQQNVDVIQSQLSVKQAELASTLTAITNLSTDHDEFLNGLLLSEVNFDKEAYQADAATIPVPSEIDTMVNGQVGSLLKINAAIQQYDFDSMQADVLLKEKLKVAVKPACEHMQSQLLEVKSNVDAYNEQILQLRSAKSKLLAAQTANAEAEHSLGDVQLRLARAQQVLAIKQQLAGMKKMFPGYDYEAVLAGIQTSAGVDASTTDVNALFTQYGTNLIASMQATTVEEKQPETVVVEETIALEVHQVVVDEKDRLEKRVAELEKSLETQPPTQVVATDAGVSQEDHQAALDTISDLRQQLETLKATSNTLPVAEDAPLPVSTASKATLRSIKNLASRSLDDLKTRTGLFGSGGSHKPQQLKALINQMTDALKGEVTKESVALFAKKYLLLIASARKRSFFGTATFAYTKSADKLCEWLTESDNDDAIALAKLMNHSDQAYQSVETARAALVDLKNNHFDVFQLGNANLLNHAENIQVNSK